MAKPTTNYLWDTHKTNVLTPTSGHISDGYVNGEVPGAGEINAQFGGWSDWIAWVDTVLDANGRPTATRIIPVGFASFRKQDGDSGLLTSSEWDFNSGGSEPLFADLQLPAGSVISRVDWGYNRSAGATIITALTFWDFPSTGTHGTVAPTSGSGSDTTSSGDHVNTLTYAPYTTLPNVLYTLFCEQSGTPGASLLYGALVYVV